MADSKYNVFVKNFNTIRDVFRNAYLYGCYTREDFESFNISSRKVDNEFRRISAYFKKTNIEYRWKSSKKYTSITKDSFHDLGNIFAEAFYTKAFTRNDIVLFFYIIQTINLHQDGIGLAEITDYINSNNNIGDTYYEKSTVYKNCEDLVLEGYLYKNEDKKYRLVNSVFNSLDKDEANNIYLLILFFQGLAKPAIPGYYLEKTLLKRYKHFVNKNIIRYRPIIFKHHNIESILDDEIMFKIFESIWNKNKIKVKYNEKEKVINPTQIVIDQTYGRQYAQLINNDKNIMYLRIDKMKEAEPIDEESIEFRIVDEFSWSTSKSLHDSKPVIVEFKLVIDNENELFIFERLMKERRHGEVFTINEHEVMFKISVYDPIEMIPWLRTFLGYILIIPSKDHNLVKQFNDEIEKMREMYEDI